jgi:RNA polymerase sigma-70 factor (ECF subfamily)
VKENSSEDARDVALMKRIARGDTEAFKSLFDLRGRQLMRLAYAYMQSHDLAEDVIQDVFVALWEKREQLDIHDRVMPLLVRLTRNRALNILRDRARAERREHAVALEQALLRPIALNLGAQNMDVVDVIAAFRTVLAELPPRQREVFLLNREQGLDYRTIASALGISVPSTRNLMSKAVQAIAKRLAEKI